MQFRMTGLVLAGVSFASTREVAVGVFCWVSLITLSPLFILINISGTMVFFTIPKIFFIKAELKDYLLIKISCI